MELFCFFIASNIKTEKYFTIKSPGGTAHNSPEIHFREKMRDCFFRFHITLNTIEKKKGGARKGNRHDCQM